MKRCAFLLLFAVAAHAAPPAEWMGTPGARAEYVDEPVFGGRVALYRAGPAEAKTVVLVHGLGKPAARDWSALIPALARRHEVIALDLPGFGHSDKGNHHYSPDNYVRVLDAVVAKPQRFTLVGHSMGAAVAIAYAAAHPERVERLVLLDPACHGAQIPWFLLSLPVTAFAVATRTLGATPLRAALPLAYRHLAIDRDYLAGFMAPYEMRGSMRAVMATARALPAAIATLDQRLGEIRQPTLVIWGEKDALLPVGSAWRLMRRVPHARLVVLAESAHCPHEEAPERVNQLIAEAMAG